VTYLLDTNACIALMNDRPRAVRQRFAAAVAEDAVIAVSSIATFELWYGVGKSRHQTRNRERLQTFLGDAPFEMLPFDEEDARVAGRERARLEAAGTPIGAYDLLIAGQALRRQIILVTANVREFSRVLGLVWQDWAKSSPG
jgi:tRNA(fMet)-specific endonuclease VapC